ncbi:epoxide hydrolase, soluble (sEH) [Dipsacomyces acuminosporus]|nr:epoxide hydrolase, soluble (sEH) [Dipsacomyces acuminosporus]
MSIPVNHDDFIHDVAYNFYGTRLATCGSDKCIKIWDWNKQTGLWILNETLHAHDSSVLKLCWAHPEFGQVLASCSLDRTVKIWVEQESNKKNSNRRWKCVATLVESTCAIHSIAFAPEYTNLTIATASSDGTVRFYSPTDAVSLRNWTVSTQFSFIPGGATDSDGPLCLSWCKSRFSAPHMIVVGGSKGNSVKIFQLIAMQCNEILELDSHDALVLDVDWAPSMGRSYHLIATACSDGCIRIYKFWSDPAAAETASKKQSIADSLFIHEDDDFEKDDAGDDNDEEIEVDDEEEEDYYSEQEEEEEEDDDDEEEEERSDDDVSANEDNDEYETLVKQNDAEAGGLSPAGFEGSLAPAKHARRRHSKRSAAKGPSSELIGELSIQPKVPIRHIRWNSTGTLLVSSSDDGVTRMWKMTVNGTWREIAAITAEKSVPS